ncbi:MAG: hypothetical protein WCG87_10485 [Bacteroidota bacterium]
MKKVILATILSLSIGLGFTACNKSNSTSTYSTSTYGVHAMIRGVQFDATDTKATHRRDTLPVHLRDTVTIIGKAPIGLETEVLSLTVYNFIGAANYKILPGTHNASAYFTLKGDTIRATYGNIYLQTLDSIRMQGTFYFSSDSLKADSLIVHDGTFNVINNY